MTGFGVQQHGDFAVYATYAERCSTLSAVGYIPIEVEGR